MKHPRAYIRGLILLISLAVLNCAGSRKTGRLAFVSLDEELAMGKEFASQAAQQFPLVQDPEIDAFLNKIAQEIGAQSDWSGLKYTVHLVNEPDLNHFSLPGGHIYLYRGVVENATNASEVAAVIAHEIAHLAARDGVERMAQKYGYALAAQSVMGENPEIPSQIVANLYTPNTILDYPKKAEQEADRKSAIYAWKADYDPAGLLLFLLKIRQMKHQSPSRVALLTKTHPSAPARYRSVNNEIERLNLKESIRADLPEFAVIKERLKKIPY